MHAVPQFHALDMEVRSIPGGVLMHSPVLQIKGTAACLGVDALDERAMRMTRFVAPVTMLATGGAGQVPISPFGSAAHNGLNSNCLSSCTSL